MSSVFVLDQIVSRISPGGMPDFEQTPNNSCYNIGTRKRPWLRFYILQGRTVDCNQGPQYGLELNNTPHRSCSPYYDVSGERAVHRCVGGAAEICDERYTLETFLFVIISDGLQRFPWNNEGAGPVFGCICPHRILVLHMFISQIKPPYAVSAVGKGGQPCHAEFVCAVEHSRMHPSPR